MLALALLALLLTAPSATAATAALAPASGAAGERAAVWAYDLAPRQAVGLRMPDGRTRLLFADGSGRLATQVEIPAGARGRAEIELRLPDQRSARLSYRVASAWSDRRSVEVSDWAGHTLRVRTSLDHGKLVTRGVVSGLAYGTEAVARTGKREVGRATADANGVATIRRRLPDSAAGALLALAAGPVSLTAPLPTPPAVLAAVGDIACSPRAPRSRMLCRHSDTATLAAGFRPDAAALLGDIQYESGSLSAFRSSFGRTWGTLAMPLRPTPGNHEYRTPGASGYFSYFAEQAPWKPPPWYAYNLGSWHIVSLNSNCHVVACGADSEQMRWLRADLAAHRGRCTLAYWHHPRYSSGSMEATPARRPSGTRCTTLGRSWSWRAMTTTTSASLPRTRTGATT